MKFLFLTSVTIDAGGVDGDTKDGLKWAYEQLADQMRKTSLDWSADDVELHGGDGDITQLFDEVVREVVAKQKSELRELEPPAGRHEITPGRHGDVDTPSSGDRHDG